ncbi:Peptidoglycan/LPS O-acetylase OafA/YrhL, contains acyltransferase and SGNH-hydrolase domains [Chitinophaga jiangningensis]|uniref:Peptidoglycan/LPS O-acetylase OafA/YrhL, contains acyltransferase and SGNH-hydrolase domains n=1 Tax=Chitinophaga jiangningensis TaxID=1419482 RepID=A0A1M7HHG8_9BACT|nr:acyltransferase [Chitinophaga jiangningensis]SHM27904.1 Peptidoglycan/LPS O-acetylase OafA/YrhL, contains acyltransferase and SGNH-hydrolase domains [Chitinophaga jiangningensis]
MTTLRIGGLDGFRFLAISLVVLFHYYVRWAPPYIDQSYYPYGNAYSNPFFEHGHMGVQFFFMISGFVTFLSIEKCLSLKEFMQKRLIRLWPPLLLCSVVTFVFVAMEDPVNKFPFHKSVLSFLPSLTFTDPLAWQYILRDPDIALIDGVYWSLLVEMKFYLLIGFMYFLISRKHILRSWNILLIGLLCLHYLAKFSGFSPLQLLDKAAGLLFFYEHMPFFTLGICFYDFYVGKKLKVAYIIPVLLLISSMQDFDWISLTMLAVMLLLFLALVMDWRVIRPMEWSVFRKVGVVSYTLYLLHQNIGLILIDKICGWIQNPAVYAWVPVVVYGMIVGVALLLFDYFELPVKRVLTEWLFRPKVSSPQIKKPAFD